MPRLVHRPPAYRRHKSTNQAVVSFFGDKIYLGSYGSPRSLARYQELLKKWERARHQESAKALSTDELGPPPNSRNSISLTAVKLREKRQCGRPITISELIFVYRNHTQRYYQKNGEVTREAGVIDDALRILRKHYGNTCLTEFGPVALDALREAMIDELDWSRKYVNKQVSRIRSMFKWAAAKEIVDASVSAALRELPGLKKGRSRARETKRIKVVRDSVIDATLQTLPETVADMVRIQRLTSARPGEICSMAPADVDTTGDVWIYRPVEYKTEHFEKDRIIAIGPRAQKILAKYFAGRAPEAFCFSPAESEAKRRAQATANRKTPRSCGNRPGSNRVSSPRRPANDGYTTASYRRAIHRACEKLGIEKWSPNRLRHTASTEIRRRFGIDAARAVDGHSAASTTEIYAELDLSKAIEVMRTLG
jgi:integrase